MKSISLLFLFFILRIINAQNTCADKRAVCISIRDCPSLIEILRGPRPLPKETLETLRNAQCGFEGNYPMVCCINQNTEPVTTNPVPTPTTDTMVQASVPDPPNVVNHPNLRLLNHQVCGHITQEKLIGGNKTGVIEYPWMALIAYETGRGPEFRCGGTVISQRYILTAAHCVTTLPGDLTLIGVRVGDHDISKERDCDRDKNGLEILCAEKYQDFGIESVHFHPEYTRTKLQNDIALIRLNSSVDFRPFNARPICLPFGSATRLSQKRAIVTGWGATEFGPRSQDLLQIKLPLMTNEQCAEVYKNTVEIWYKQMCAGGMDMVDSCAGDSGGPLQAPSIYNAPNVNNKVRIVQYGVVSYGLKQCGTAGFPGVYTRVSYYMDWILNTIRV
ncbi:CLIP domain-containing serine protease 2-like [Odontomachus brunneus]|uniref:CLIP domain-containing serine protease 2-like n=1 Tax=Odontomachus brunneus TaxID=486640 RepID=UPI0013F1B184|nr:CLIP domain-containing serine protease 2-like [Odontomachus brunneus]